MSQISLGRAVLEITTDLAGFAAKDVEKGLKSITGLSKESMTALAQGAGMALAGVSALAAGIVALGQRGAVVSDVRSSFDALSASAGETGAVMLGSLRKGVVGTVSDFELMKMANKAMGAGLVASSGDFETLAAGARLLAKRVGGDTKDAFETLTGAMASGRTAQLKQLGMFVDSKAAVEEYSRATGKSVSSMTDADRAAALQAATLAGLKKELEQNGVSAADFGERIEKGRTLMANFTDGLAEAIASSPVVAAGMDAIASAVESAFGANQQSLVETLIGYVNEFAIYLTYLGDAAVLGARVLSGAFAGVKVIIASVGVAVSFVIEKILEGIGQFANAAASLPGIGDQFTGIAASIDNARVVVNGMRKDFQAQVGEAIDGAVAQSVALDGVSATIGTVRSSMIAARDAQSGLTAETAAGRPVVQGATGDAEALAEAQKKAAAAAEAHKKAVAALVEDLGGGKAVQAAQVWIDTLPQIGGLSKLTADEQKRLHDVMSAAIDGYAKMNATAPPAVRELWMATFEGVPVLQTLGKEFATLGQAVQANTDTWIANNATVNASFKQLQADLTLANKTGIDRRLMEIDLARQRELAGLAVLKATHAKEYAELAAMVNAKYQEMTDAATGHNRTAVQLAEDAGFRTRAELQATADLAMQTYLAMKESGEFNAQQLQAAFEAAEAAKRAAADQTKQHSLASAADVASGVLGILQQMGIKHKSMAIAGAIISTYQAVAKSLASAPWPKNLIAAAGALAAGMATVAKIKSSDAGFRMGTPDLDFLNFGPERMVPLHGEEAVIPRGAGKHELAGEIAEGLMDQGRGGAISDRPIEITVISKLDGRKVAQNQIRYIPDGLAFAGVTS
jgi:hypothetical protein